MPQPDAGNVQGPPLSPRTDQERSPLLPIFSALGAQDPVWRVEIGEPQGEGWISGSRLRRVTVGPFDELLGRIGQRAATSDRRTIAALFALRFGWTSGMAISACLRHAAVPDVSLDNLSLKFKENSFFERLALHVPRGAAQGAAAVSSHPLVERLPADARSLHAHLRQQLVKQAQPVVDALHDWSGFALRGTWGLLTSSWAAHVTSHYDAVGEPRAALPVLADIFRGDDLATTMQPRLYVLAHGDAVRVFQRRASCCRYYLVPRGELCTSCPLVSDAERTQRNTAWMKRQADGPVGTGHHA